MLFKQAIVIVIICAICVFIYEFTYSLARKHFAVSHAKCVGYGKEWGRDIWIYKTSQDGLFIMQVDP